MPLILVHNNKHTWLIMSQLAFMHKILFLHGPNLNLLGLREPDLYGNETLERLNQHLLANGKQLGLNLEIFQSNSEAELIEKIQQAYQDNFDFMIVNPAAFTHTSVAMRDAIAAVNIPFIEIHISNIYAREPFRHHSYFSDLALAVISGLGVQGYHYALEAAHHFLHKQQH